MHECPDCGQACYCDGDIDDIDTGPKPLCTCCIEDDDYEDDYWDEEGEQ